MKIEVGKLYETRGGGIAQVVSYGKCHGVKDINTGKEWSVRADGTAMYRISARFDLVALWPSAGAPTYDSANTMVTATRSLGDVDHKHDWFMYLGLNESFECCKSCGVKKADFDKEPVSPTLGVITTETWPPLTGFMVIGGGGGNAGTGSFPPASTASLSPTPPKYKIGDTVNTQHSSNLEIVDINSSKTPIEYKLRLPGVSGVYIAPESTILSLVAKSPRLSGLAAWLPAMTPSTPPPLPIGSRTVTQIIANSDNTKNWFMKTDTNIKSIGKKYEDAFLEIADRLQDVVYKENPWLALRKSRELNADNR